MRRRRQKKGGGGAPKWMVTYSDMVTLILVFFVLLFSMSQVDVAKFEAVSESFRNRVILDFLPSAIPMEHPVEDAGQLQGGQPSEKLDPPTAKQNDDEDDEEEEEDSLETLMDDITSYLTEHELDDVISANRTERGVV